MDLMQTIPGDPFKNALVPHRELGAYEALWSKPGASFKRLAEMFHDKPGWRPSNFVERSLADEYGNKVHRALSEAGVLNYGIGVRGFGEYPKRLEDADYPLQVFCYQGDWSYMYAPISVAVVGTRNPSDEGVQRTRKLVDSLVTDGVLVVSGLARGIDEAAHTAAVDKGGRTMAVIGTPLSHTYPSENTALQREIARKHLVVSQVPYVRYSRAMNPTHNRYFFPARNVTMSALTQATIIVEAGETSGALIQAKAALAQGRKLFILESCFQKPSLTWPHKFAEKGAIRVRDYADIQRWIVPNDTDAN